MRGIGPEAQCWQVKGQGGGGFEDRLLGDDSRTCWWIRCGRKGERGPRVEPSFPVLATMKKEPGEERVS